MKKLIDIPQSSYDALLYTKGDKVTFYMNFKEISYDTPINLKDGTYLEYGEWDRYAKTPKLPKGFVTINELKAKKKLLERSFTNEFQLVVRNYKNLFLKNGKLSYARIRRIFKRHGFDVTDKALEHNYGCWRDDLKSGFRDEENGYHLFTPCGCNPLSFTATKLNGKCDYWQKTYIA